MNVWRCDVPLFVISAFDKPGALETRMANRPAHLEHIRGNPKIKLAGPYKNEADELVGSLMILEADDIGEVRAFWEADPYVKAGVFGRADIHPFMVGVGSL
jgi:uncharacterized protein YciI